MNEFRKYFITSLKIFEDHHHLEIGSDAYRIAWPHAIER